MILRLLCRIGLHPWKKAPSPPGVRNLQCRTPGCNAVSGW